MNQNHLFEKVLQIEKVRDTTMILHYAVTPSFGFLLRSETR